MPPRTNDLAQPDDPAGSAGGDELLALRDSWHRSLQARNCSPETIRSYLAALHHFRAYLQTEALPLRLQQISRRHCEAFIADVARRRRPATVATRWRGLRQFWNWCVEEEEIAVSPMTGMKRPTIPVDPPGVLTKQDIEKLLRVCRGNDFLARRDTAIIRLLVDCGLRRAEIAHLKIGDIDWNESALVVVGKGNRTRICAFGRKAARDLDRYLRVRAQHRHAECEWLWLGLSGRGPRLADESIYRMVRRRAQQAAIGRTWTHLFRHTFAHMWLDAGGQESQLMHLGGWRDYQTMMRYGGSVAAARAREAHKRFSPGDQI